MPSVVTAQSGDTLCTIAMMAGFLDCQPLRDLPANAALLNRDLVAGDLVTVPDVDPSEVAKGTTATHVFVRKTSPPVLVRFVHGSPNTPYRQDLSLSVLNVSNYRTTKAGQRATDPFPDQFEFQQTGHVDPDTFKIEVVDPRAGASVNVILEAMKPILAAGSAPGIFTVTGFQPFGGAERSIPALNCAKVRSGVAYRSKYLRLVTDALASDTRTADKQSKPAQTLLVSDFADGNGSGLPGDNDSIEILDQQVRASYVIQKCPGGTKCTVRAQLPIGGGDRKRLRMVVHIFKDSFNGDNVGGIVPEMVRLRTAKWFRRAYAQAAIGPLLVSPFVTIEEPPPASDMLVISADTGANASGVRTVGGNSTLSFRLTAEPGSPIAVPNVNVPPIDLGAISPPRTPEKVADAVIAALPAGFSGVKFPNIPALHAPRGSCDIIISHAGGGRVAIRNIVQNDSAAPAFSVRATAVDTTAMNIDIPGNSINVNTGEQRRVMRLLPGTDDVLHFYVVDTLVDANGPGTRGVAIMRLEQWPAANHPTAPARNKVFLASESIDASDTNPVSFPHEAGHVLGDNFHASTKDANGAFEMMTGGGTSSNNAENSSKRICDTPVLVRYDVPAPAFLTTVATAEAQRIRTNGAGLLQDW